MQQLNKLTNKIIFISLLRIFFVTNHYTYNTKKANTRLPKPNIHDLESVYRTFILYYDFINKEGPAFSDAILYNSQNVTDFLYTVLSGQSTDVVKDTAAMLMSDLYMLGHRTFGPDLLLGKVPYTKSRMQEVLNILQGLNSADPNPLIGIINECVNNQFITPEEAEEIKLLIFRK